jgi:hypothetical protein
VGNPSRVWVPEARSPGSWPPEAGGTLLAVVPVNDGAARMAIVGYLLPPGPAPAASVRPAQGGPNLGGPAAARPVTGSPVTGGPVTGHPATRGPATGRHSGDSARPPGLARPFAALRPDPSGPGVPGPFPLPPADGLDVDVASRRVLVGGRDAGLVYQEFELLRYLVANAGQALSREQIFRSVWGEEPYEGSRTVDIHVHRIRRKLGPAHGCRVVTVRRVGYRYEPPAAG